MKMITILPTILRSMVYQANWNTSNLQGTGFIWLVKDLFRRNQRELPKDIEVNRPEYFNTNPYFIMFILGMLLKESENSDETQSFLHAYSSAFAALGDTFFWHSLRPFTFFVALLISVVAPNLAIVIYLLIYNVFHFGFRFFGFYVGYTLGRDMILGFKRISFNRWGDILDYCSIFIMGLLLSIGISFYGEGSLIILKILIAFIGGIALSFIVMPSLGALLVIVFIGILLKIGV